MAPTHRGVDAGLVHKDQTINRETDLHGATELVPALEPPVRLEFVVRPPLGAGPSPGSGRSNGHCSARLRRHATLPQSWIQRENWEFETHGISKSEVSRICGRTVAERRYFSAESMQQLTTPTLSSTVQEIVAAIAW